MTDTATPDGATDAAHGEHVEDIRGAGDVVAARDDGPPSLDVHPALAAESARDVASDAAPDTSPEASLDAQLEDAPDDVRDVAADLTLDRADILDARDATPDVTSDDTAPRDANADADATPPDVFSACGDAPVAADARRDDAGQPCGQNGQACCAAGSECDVGLGCVSTYGICAPFGEVGGPCFSDRRCAPGLRCEGPGSGRCVCAGASDACGSAAGWACRELVTVAASYQYVCCRMPGAACCSDRDCCGRIAGTAACRDGVCTRTGFVCNLPPSSCRSTPCCAPFRCEFDSQLCTDGN